MVEHKEKVFEHCLGIYSGVTGVETIIDLIAKEEDQFGTSDRKAIAAFGIGFVFGHVANTDAVFRDAEKGINREGNLTFLFHFAELIRKLQSESILPASPS